MMRPAFLKMPLKGNWLPFVALLLCLVLFAMAGVLLLNANSEPVTGQSAYVTGVSAQGDQGLKRLLLATGHTVTVNREESPPGLSADIEIITLDGDNANLLFGFDPSKPVPDDEDDDDDEESAGSSASASASASAAPVQVQVRRLAARPYGAPAAPDPKRVQHILYHPLGRVVLVVAPKWSADRMIRHPLWDVDPGLIPAEIIDQNLSVLNPAEARPRDLDDKSVPPAPPPGRRLLQNGRRLITFDAYDYAIRRDTRPKTPAETKADDAARKAMGGMGGSGGIAALASDVPLRRHWTLRGKGFPDFDAGVITGLQSVTAANLQPVLTTRDGRPVLSRVIVTGHRPQPVAPVYLLSEPDLLNNQILSDPKRTATALNLIDSLAPARSGKSRPSIVFNLTFAGMGFDHDLLHTLARPPWLAAPLCLILTGLALMWAAFSRFGPPLAVAEGAPLGRGVRLLADNAARLMALTLKEPRLAPAYAQHVRDLVLKRRGYMLAGSQEPPDELADRIGRAHGTSDSFLDLKARADKTLTVHQLIDITRRLYAWKTEIERAHN